MNHILDMNLVSVINLVGNAKSNYSFQIRIIKYYLEYHRDPIKTTTHFENKTKRTVEKWKNLPTQTPILFGLSSERKSEYINNNYLEYRQSFSIVESRP